MAQYKGAAKEANRAMNLLKKRQKEREELELRKKKIEEDSKVGVIEQKFAVHYDAVENQLKTDTIGLVTLDQMKAKQDEVVKERERQMVAMKELAMSGQSLEKNKEKTRKQGPLSFHMGDDDEDEEEEEENEDGEKEKEDDDEEEDETLENEASKRNAESDNKDNDAKRFKMMKCPFVDTSFLPDREREEREARMREELRQEWTRKQEAIKAEEIEITYSYWDGSGHRRVVRMKKGHTIQQFLQRCLEQLKNEFNELKSSSVDRLMYIKEDLIIAHHYSFYDFIVTKARGKSGPLFNFDVHDDVRMLNDAAVEKDESHAGKVCLRSWYDKNKHIFPASRWEPYDPDKEWGKYTVSDKEVIIK